MKWINQILRGVIIGIANIIPGVSGGTMMVSMGVYDTLIHCITHLFSDFKQSVKTLLPYLVGMVLGIFALASLLTYCFTYYPLQTGTTFIGLILGGLAPLVRKMDRKKLDWAAALLFVAFFALIVVLAVADPADTGSRLQPSVGQAFVLLLIGVVASATMLIPGVSGSMVLMLLGYYRPVLASVSDFKDGLLGSGINLALSQLAILIPFGIGILLGIYFVAKAIGWLIARFPTHTYSGVLGLVLASPIAVLLRTDMSAVSAGTVLASMVTFAVGFVLAMLLARGGEGKAAAEPADANPAPAAQPQADPAQDAPADGR